MFSGEIDPEIADLMGIDSTAASSSPEYSDLFSNGKIPQVEKEKVNLTKTRFESVTKYSEKEKPFFKDKDYYKNLLAGTGPSSGHLHTILTSFLGTEDPKDRSTYRGKLIAAYWNFAEILAKSIQKGFNTSRQLMLRFGLLHPGIVSQEQRQMLSTVIMKNTSGEPIHYVDEWLNKIITGEVNPSATDETKAVKQHTTKKVHSKLENIRGQYTFNLGNMQTKIADMQALEYSLKDKTDHLTHHIQRDDLDGIKTGYTSEQKQSILEIQSIIKELLILDREAGRIQKDLEQLSEQLEKLEDKSDTLGGIQQVDDQTIVTEFNTVRQMHKLCVGRQGNHVPILMKNYFWPQIKEAGIREVVISELAYIESLDPGLFLRTFKQQTNRIVPHIILVPCYGERGICWEPFERFNKASSRGRVAVPIFSKDIKTAIIAACGDLRWQVAKEKAQHYWMEEGLTGRYYQWFTSKKIRGDVKEYFIQDYILWITKESEGTQKLDRDVRGVFWRFVPFPDPLKETLRNRGFVYNDLFKKDINRAKSDGY